MQWCVARGAIGAAGGRCKLQIQIQIQSALCLLGRQERARVSGARLCGQSAWAKRVSEQSFMATGAQRNAEKHGKAERACSERGVMGVLLRLRVQRLPLCCGLTSARCCGSGQRPAPQWQMGHQAAPRWWDSPGFLHAVRCAKAGAGSV